MLRPVLAGATAACLLPLASAASTEVTAQQLAVGVHRSCIVRASGDTYVSSASPSSAHGSETAIHVRSDASDNRRSFVKFAVEECSIPVHARVRTAQVSLLLEAAPAISRSYDIHALTEAWSDGSATWTNQPAATSTPTSTAVVGTVAGALVSWPVRGDVEAIVKGTAQNHGWRIADAGEPDTMAHQSSFTASESTTTSARPALEITYYE